MPPAKRTLTLDVSRQGEQSLSVAADVFLPAFPAANAALLFCIAGATFTRGVFSLGESRDDTNFARSMTARGHVVVAVDLVGVGDSTIPADGAGISLGAESEWMQRAVAEVRRKTIGGIRLGRLPAIGIGHSEGGMVIGVMQGGHGVFDAIALLGFSLVGTPQRLTNETLFAIRTGGAEAAVPQLVREQFGGAAYFRGAGSDSESARARAVRTTFPTAIAAFAMVPGHISREVAMITSPVFVAASDRDGAGAVPGVVAALSSCPDYTCFVIIGATDALFDAGGIGALYERLNNWLTAIVIAEPGMSEPSTTVTS